MAKTILLLLIVAMALSAGPIYTVTDLGGLGGSSAVGFKINESGATVGWATTAIDDQHAFLALGGGTLQDLYPGSSEAYAFGINASGAVAGTSYESGLAHGEIWSASGTTDLGAGVLATGINDPGAVIGSNGHAFMLVNGAYRDLGTLPGGDWSSAYGINNSGVVAGYGNVGPGTFRGFVWTADGGMTELATLGGNNSYAMSINSAGEVVGHAATVSGYDHAFLALGAFLSDLGTLGGGNSYAYGINDAGSVVGYSDMAGGGNPHGFIWTNGAMADLNSLIGTGSGWELTQGYGINNTGQIVGEGLYNGQSRAFRLDPIGPTSIPEPASWLLLGIGLLCIAKRIR
ncbi:MAG TPA: PEP-CTERM sorting domain-containing protein [Bryobacteraceae bacterium]|nr:PEP-CTERM sorting domain-containing protein [Bryobacteraceae bacterium]